MRLPMTPKEKGRKPRLGIFLTCNPAVTRGGDIRIKYPRTSKAGRHTHQPGEDFPLWDFLSCLMSGQTHLQHLPPLQHALICLCPGCSGGSYHYHYWTPGMQTETVRGMIVFPKRDKSTGFLNSVYAQNRMLQLVAAFPPAPALEEGDLRDLSTRLLAYTMTYQNTYTTKSHSKDPENKFKV
ncbi:hypothetical protein XENOCAPTIV_024120 [Xenoophorus captivus]|uniref:Uncharacterized protein n=1 Tax=Xenoophorus captivus TaxID=1517983 RepID=A0ABV0SE18_9TELE